MSSDLLFFLGLQLTIFLMGICCEMAERRTDVDAAENLRKLKGHAYVAYGGSVEIAEGCSVVYNLAQAHIVRANSGTITLEDYRPQAA